MIMYLASAVCFVTAVSGGFSVLVFLENDPSAAGKEISAWSDYVEYSKDVSFIINAAIVNMLVTFPLLMSLVFFAIARVLVRLEKQG